MDIVLEVGLNHFGKISFSKRYLNYFFNNAPEIGLNTKPYNKNFNE